MSRLLLLLACFFPSLSALVRAAELDLAKAREHWAYRLPADPAVPIVNDSAWPRSNIDRFILHALESRGLSPSASASREVLLRRLHFDLVGLPPSPDEIRRFEADLDPKAVERVVDRLLASPHFGERWGRHWLDVARYAESVTLRGLIFGEAWRYRDYVIDSFNRDVPFDQFIREQIAGDLLDRPALAEKHRALAATTFLVLGNFNYEEQDKEQLRMDIVDEQLDVIGKAFLAQTLGCARCHDHKFDPIPARDYYALAGILRNTKSAEHANVSNWLEVPLPLESAEEARVKARETRLAELQRQIRKKVDEVAQAGSGAGNLAGVLVDDSQATLVGVWKKSQYNKPFLGEGYIHDEGAGQGTKTATFHPVLPKAGRYEVRFAYTAGGNRASNVPVTILHAGGETNVRVDERAAPPIAGHFVSLGQFEFEQGNQGYVLVSNLGADGHVIADAVHFLPADQLATASPAQSTEAARLQMELEALRLEVRRASAEGPQRPMAMSVREEASIVDYPIHLRGSVHRLGEIVPRGFLRVASYDPAPVFGSEQSGRRELAEWLASPRNPLTARVFVNRAWHWLFGAGIVRSTDNFGATGDRPTHPELLDFLAVRFVERGWSVKSLVREMVLSRVYALSSQTDPAALEADPENRLLARASSRRVDAELMRDAMLSAAGKLDLAVGGPTIKSGSTVDYGYSDDSLRRSVYIPAFRNALPQIFELFDFADVSVVTGQRSSSIVAPQALYFLNHPFVLEQSAATAARLLASASPDGERAETLSLLLLGRRPTAAERAMAFQHLAEARRSGLGEHQAWTELCQALFASRDFRHID